VTKLTKTPISAITSEMEELFDRHLGPGRFARTAYRLREQSSSTKPVGINVFDQNKLVGTVSLTELIIGGEHCCFLLGPLLIDECHRSKGLGLELINDAIELAKTKDAAAILLVGDIAYYEKAGFKQIQMGQIKLPGPVDPARLLMFEIGQGAINFVKGVAKTT
jgi:predicted N-acetyltransferase YhbS